MNKNPEEFHTLEDGKTCQFWPEDAFNGNLQKALDQSTLEKQYENAKQSIKTAPIGWKSYFRHKANQIKNQIFQNQSKTMQSENFVIKGAKNQYNPFENNAQALFLANAIRTHLELPELPEPQTQASEAQPNPVTPPAQNLSRDYILDTAPILTSLQTIIEKYTERANKVITDEAEHRGVKYLLENVSAFLAIQEREYRFKRQQRAGTVN